MASKLRIDIAQPEIIRYFFLTDVMKKAQHPAPQHLKDYIKVRFLIHCIILCSANFPVCDKRFYYENVTKNCQSSSGFAS